MPGSWRHVGCEKCFGPKVQIPVHTLVSAGDRILHHLTYFSPFPLPMSCSFLSPLPFLCAQLLLRKSSDPRPNAKFEACLLDCAYDAKIIKVCCPKKQACWKDAHFSSVCLCCCELSCEILQNKTRVGEGSNSLLGVSSLTKLFDFCL